MTLMECYRRFGGDYEDTLHRLGKETLLRKLALRFTQNSGMAELRSALGEAKVEEAFRYAHTLKGVALNLGFTALAESSAALTELLRGGEMKGSAELLSKVERDYAAIEDAIALLE